MAFIQELASTLKLESDALDFWKAIAYGFVGSPKFSQRSTEWKFWRKEYFLFFTKLEGLKGAKVQPRHVRKRGGGGSRGKI